MTAPAGAASGVDEGARRGRLALVAVFPPIAEHEQEGGGDEDRAGDGEGKRGGGNGGRCEAVADGGTVTIGDVNP